MIYEFRTYTTPIGMAPELARLSAEIGRDVRRTTTASSRATG